MASLLTNFAAEWLFTLAATATLAWVGLPFTIPFRDDQRFSLLLAPMLGLITLPMVVAAVYIFARMSLLSSAIAALASMSVVSIVVAARWRPARHNDLPILVLVLIVSAVSTILSSAAAIQSGATSITFIDGSDQAGYGHPADWLIDHGIARRPIVNPDVPYESWPQLMLSLDPRLSSFVFVALIAMARGVSGLFAYDAACTIVGTVGPMAVAAVFARTRSTLFLLTLALMTTTLFDLGRSGYLGKIAGYPGALMLVGLFMTSTQRHLPWLATVIALTVGVAALHSGAATAFLLLMIGATFLIARLVLNFRDGDAPRLFLNDGTLLVLLMFIAVVASGVFARPVDYPPGNALPFGWGWLLERFFEIENAQTDRVRALLPWLTAVLQIAIGLQLAAIAVALLAGNALAIALCASPMVMLAALYFADMKWIALQIFSLLTCCTLVGIAVLHDDLRIAGRKSAHLAILMLGLAFVAVRLPRFAVAMDRYAFRTDPHYRYDASQYPEIRRLVDQGTLEIDTEEPLPLLGALTELGRGGIKLQWSERAWRRAFGYRRWPPRTYPVGPDFRLTARGDQPSTGVLILQTPQYQLWRLQ
jgi:hypothetical protein